MTGRHYPQRGDLVHVVEGGHYWKHSSVSIGDREFPSLNGTPILQGAVLPITGTYDAEDGLVGVYLNGGRMVDPGSWVPVYGPPIASVIIGPDALTSGRTADRVTA